MTAFYTLNDSIYYYYYAQHSNRWRDHLTFAFKLSDDNGDGTIDVSEWQDAIHVQLKANHLNLSDEVLEEMQHAFFESEDPMAEIDSTRLIRLVAKDPSSMKKLKFNVVKTLMPPEEGTKPKKFEMFPGGKKPPPPRFCDLEWYRANTSKAICLALYFVVHIALGVWVFTERMIETVNGSYWGVIIARVGGMWLNFNCALIILPMVSEGIAWVGKGGETS